MPRLTLPLQSRCSIETRSTPLCRSTVSARRAWRPPRDVFRPAHYRAPCPCGRKPDDIPRSSERYFDCCWSER